MPAIAVLVSPRRVWPHERNPDRCCRPKRVEGTLSMRASGNGCSGDRPRVWDATCMGSWTRSVVAVGAVRS